ncbi:MAG: SDR family NAD(P)-dependent oxidoreductase [Brevinematia bacterium]
MRIFELVSLEGKVAMITGAGNGIGKSIAKILSDAGAFIYAVDIDEKSLLELEREFLKEGRGIKVFKFDLSNEEEIYKLWREVKGEEPNILVNNVGFYPFKNFLEVDKSILEKTISINLKSCFWMCQKMIKQNIERGRGGIIVNVSSIEAILPFEKGLVHYSASKAGVIAITRALSKEFASKGFRINAILPGGIGTKGTKSIASKALLNFNIKLLMSGYRFWDRLPAKKVGKPEDVAKVVLALVSDLFSYVHGAIIPVDGGFLSA